ncbi:MAG TPA: sigma-70 family RNA polymerase sigma factor, partial [Microlunatus sp.]|nr:sigma-70 family RNA polymerase sigma factor [Microlunatus sp.]
MTADREWGDSPGPSDAELIKECRAGNTEAAGLLFRRHHDAALAYARKLAGSSRADDIAAEAFTKTLAQLGDGKGPDAAFRPYLISAVHNTFVSMIRSDDRYVLVDDPGTLEQEPEEVEEEPFAGLVAEAFAELPERWQVVLWHTLIEGDSLEVTAGHLGVSPAAVGSLSYRARRGLSNVLMAKLAVEGEECLPTRELLRKNPDELSLKQRNALNRHLEVCDNCERLAAVVPAAAPSGVAGLLIAGLVGVGGGAYLALRQPAVAAAAGVAGAGAAGGASGGGAAGGGASGAGASGAGASGGGASGSGGSGAVQPPRPPLSKAWLAAPAGVAVVVLAVLVARALQPPPPETSAPDPGGAPPVVQTSVPRPTTQPPPPPRQSPPPPRQTPPSRSPSTRTTPPRPPEPRP